MNEKWIEDFWSDGNWGARQARRDAEADARFRKRQADEVNRIREEFFKRKAREAMEEFYKVFGEDRFHEGPCCGSCQEDPIQDIGCCCNAGLFALENKDYEPKYPPINGELPPEFEYFGDRTRERYLKRFEKELNPSVRNVQ